VALILAGSAASWGGTLTLAAGKAPASTATRTGAGAAAPPIRGPRPPLAPAPLRTDVAADLDPSEPGLARRVQRRADRRADALSRLVDKSAERDLQLRRERAAERRARAAAQAAARAARIEELANQWTAPVDGYVLTARYGEVSPYWSTYHTGLDFAAPTGSPIVSAAQGTVTYLGVDGAYGNKTEVTLEDGTVIWYAHQSSQLVEVGDVVQAGESIGFVGATGNVTGPHLHLEIRLPETGDLVDGSDVDPYEVFADHGVVL